MASSFGMNTNKGPGTRTLSAEPRSIVTKLAAANRGPRPICGASGPRPSRAGLFGREGFD